MKQISEFLTNKIKSDKYLLSDISLEAYVEKLFGEVYKENDESEIKVLVENFMEIANKNKFGHVRVFGDCRDVNKAISELGKFEVAEYYEDIVKNDLHGDCIEDASENSDDAKSVTANDYYEMCWSDYYIYIENQSTKDGIMFEKYDVEQKGKISTYWSNRTKYVELSRRPLQSEIKNIPYDDDRFWANYNEFCSDYINLLEEKTGVESKICGNGGKHLCAKATMNLIHNYDHVLDVVKDLQDKLKDDLQDEANYWNEQNEEENN